MAKKKEDEYLKLNSLQKKGTHENQTSGKGDKNIDETVTNIANPIFKKNLQALFQQDEILAARLWGMKETEKYDYLIHLITDAAKVNYGILSVIHKQCYEEMTKVVTFDTLQTEFYTKVTSETPKKKSHFRKLFFS